MTTETSGRTFEKAKEKVSEVLDQATEKERQALGVSIVNFGGVFRRSRDAAFIQPESKGSVRLN